MVLAITTSYNAVNVYYSRKQLIDVPLNPGLKLALWPQVVRDALYTINTWLTDGYLVSELSTISSLLIIEPNHNQLFRCFIVWSGPWQYFVIILPVLLYLASVSCSVALLVFSGSPGSTYSTEIVQAFGTSNWSISLALNAGLTALIACRLIYYRKRIQRVLGPKHGSVYGAILAISIECSLLYASFALLQLVFFVTNSELSSVFFAMEGGIQVSVFFAA